ncbi:methyl jasmonate esterase 1-like isoform X1 [Magnolia sinica]|uniref:methyl jasmonate esterase 1-like isoform X1 n=1 Tax=Magnolia sinica TaxID=86752 RepID=UPI002659231D|nr:methyl jasmonate esterase 1-like isoform X1 [Magnolia sinica]
MKADSNTHFVLVHGGCHGAWSWFKLSTLLTSAGHQVTAIDLAACGVHPKRINEIGSFHDYTQPLMDLMASLSPHKRVILVGHSFGGVVISLAMERFPEKILVAVFVTAVMPNLASPPSIIVKEVFQRLDTLLDCRFEYDERLENALTSVIFGPTFMATKLYQCCSPEDHTLGTMLVRPGKPFQEDTSKENMLSKENYGSVSRVYIVCKEDELIKEDLQHWIIANNPPKEVMEIDGSDHMVMLSKPRELCDCLLEVAERYA